MVWDRPETHTVWVRLRSVWAWGVVVWDRPETQSGLDSGLYGPGVLWSGTDLRHTQSGLDSGLYGPGVLWSGTDLRHSLG